MRAPIYNSDWPRRRVISAPSGLWFPQRKVADQGTREEDCWEHLTMACSLEDAKSVAFSYHSQGERHG